MRTIGLRYIDPRTLRDAKTNPNKMQDFAFATLVANMRKANACVQPLLVREVVDADDVYEQIVDGHHRKLAAIEADLKTVPCFVVACDDDEAVVLGMGLNKIRGELDTTLTAQLLAELERDGWSALELTATGLQPTEIETMLALAHPASDLGSLLGANTRDVREDDAIDELEDKRVFELKVEFKTPEAIRAVKRLLSKARGKGEHKRSLAAALCSALQLDEHAKKE